MNEEEGREFEQALLKLADSIVGKPQRYEDVLAMFCLSAHMLRKGFDYTDHDFDVLLEFALTGIKTTLNQVPRVDSGRPN